MYKVTLNFTKVFKRKAILFGLTYDDTLGFVSVERALNWLLNVNNNKHCDYYVINSEIVVDKPV